MYSKLLSARCSGWSHRVGIVFTLILLATGRAIAAPPQPVINIIDAAGQVPFTAHVHALGSTYGAGDQLTARFQWDFGDPGSPYNTLEGWNAAHHYSSPGVYTITVTITNELGEVSTDTQSVNVSQSSRSTLYVAANGSDSNPGSFNQPLRTYFAALDQLGDNTAVLFRRGDTFDVPGSGNLSSSNVYFSAYGTGADPILEYSGGFGFSGIVKANPVIQDVTFENLVFTSIHQADDDRDVVDAIVPAGTNFTVINCSFGEVSLAVNTNREPEGFLLQDCTAGAIGAYLVWGQGSDHTYLGNSVEYSHFEHNIRLANVDRVLIAHNDLRNDPKRTIWCMLGKNVFITQNFTRDGRITVGPNAADGGTSLRSDWVAVERNICTKIGGNGTVELLGGAEHVVIRNNVIEGPSVPCIALQGLNSTGRTTRDIRILNNTGITTGAVGRFVSVGDGSADLILQNNLYIAPALETGASQTAVVYVLSDNLNAFDDISGNVWTIPDKFIWVEDGYHYVWPTWASASGYKTPAEWNAYGVVSNEAYETVVLNAQFAPPSGSNAATHSSPVAGVQVDLYGQKRRTNNAWSAGAVELNPADGDEPLTGACCLNDGSCVGDQMSLQCAGLGGTFQGIGSTCGGVSCPQPPVTGACCLTSGVCNNNQTSSGCNAVGGVYQGNDTTCAGVNCPQPPATGACCFPSGTCANDQTADQCNAAGGDYQGDDSFCGTANCPRPPATGACCLASGSCSSDRTAAECLALGGAYQGDGSSCFTSNCPQPPVTGACCLQTGTCIGDLTLVGCVSIGGTYHGNDTTCGTVNCPPPPPPTGTCCLPTGSCIEGQTQVQCGGIGGTYQGDGTICATTDCTPPADTGACCFSTGSCLGGRTEAQCVGLGGTYQGDDSTCASVDCAPPAPTGACCFPPGNCSNNLTLTVCIATGGTYQGDNQTCAAVNCPQPTGACCAPDGSCSVVTAAACAASGGAYNGNNVSCGSVNCPQPPTACCLPDGSCTETFTLIQCSSAGGTYFGFGTSCAAANCPPPPPPTGACCVPTGGCELGFTQEVCFAIGGQFQGANTVCAGVNCPPPSGACCAPNGGCIGGLTSQSCLSFGGVYNGDGSLCAEITCPEPTGACCLPNGSCVVNQTNASCTGFGGVFQGAGVICATVQCADPVGACCFSNGSCLDGTDGTTCAVLGGIFQGIQSTCTAVECVVPDELGACCFPDGSCVPEQSPTDCPAAGGAYAGTGVTCAGAGCPQPTPTGACCFGNGSCLGTQTAIDCAESGGVYQGNSSSCAGVNCPLPPATGACCFAGGSCFGGQTSTACASAGGTYQGDDSTCATANCPQPPMIGACCFAGGSCFGGQTSTACASAGGTYQGDDSTCATANCPQPPMIGACCIDDGSCAEALSASACSAMGGIYQGDEILCATTMCPPPAPEGGACCLADSSCVEVDDAGACAVLGGLYSGDGSDCAGVSCLGPPPVGFSDNFQTNMNWSVGVVTTFDGIWARGVPIGGGQRGDPAQDYDGSGMCYVTGNKFGNSDVDGGPARLTSPMFSAVVGAFPQLEYAVWFTNSEPDGDHLLVEISNDNGTNWTPLEMIGRTDAWLLRRRTIAPVLAPTAQMRIRFTVGDNPNNSITEAAIDAFRVVYNNVPPAADIPPPAVDEMPPTPPAPRITGDIVFEDRFSTHMGWTVSNAASAGSWERGIPVGDGLRGDPTTDADGNGYAFLTGNSPGFSDLDGGPTQLVSPPVNLADQVVASLYFNAWLVSEYDPADVIRIDVSSNNGASWAVVRTIDDTIGWETHTIPLHDVMALTAQVRIRFTIMDQFDNSTTEAGIDHVIITVPAEGTDNEPVIVSELNDDFESDQGWTTAAPPGGEGFWERGIPIGDGTRGDPTVDFDGSGQCYITENRPGNSDVDGGPMDLISPQLDVTAGNDPLIRYACWFANDDDDSDRLDVAISPDNGVTWYNVERIANTNGWQVHEFAVANFFPATDTVRLRFRVADLPNDSVTEAGIDDVSIVYDTVLPPPPPPPAPGFIDSFETDEGWTVTNFDLEDGAWQRGTPAGNGSKGDPTLDFDGSGQCYLTANRPGNSDVDGGPTVLTSPLLDGLAGLAPRIHVALWVANDEDDPADPLRVLISNNGGVSYVTVAEFIDTAGWFSLVFDVADHVAPTSAIRLAFEISDTPNNSIVEAAIDDVELFFAPTAPTLNVPFVDTMQSDIGWTSSIEGPVTDGMWERGVPVGEALRGDPPFDLDGSGFCFVTANRAGNADVDGGTVHLTSPIIDMTGLDTPMLSYGCWFANSTHDGDRLEVWISNDGGNTFVRVETFGQSDGWQRRGFFVNHFVQPTATMRLRFSVSDAPNDSITEAAIDSVALSDAHSTWPLTPAAFDAMSLMPCLIWAQHEIAVDVHFKPTPNPGQPFPEGSPEGTPTGTPAADALNGPVDEPVVDDHGSAGESSSNGTPIEVGDGSENFVGTFGDTDDT